MSALPLANYSSSGKPFWARANQQVLNISTLNASTITTDSIAVFPNAQAAGTITGQGSNGIQLLLDTNDVLANNQITLNAGNDKSLLIGLPGSQTGAFIDYTYQGRSVGTIGITPGVGIPGGGIFLVDELNDQLTMSAGALTFSPAGGIGSFTTPTLIASNATIPELVGVSSINGAVYPPQSFPPFVAVTFNSNFTPGNTGYVVPTSNTLIASFPTTVGGIYRVTMNPTFNNTAPPAAGDYLSVYGTGSLGPNDTIDFVTLNLNWCGTGLTPGLAQAYGQGVCGIMTAENSNYEIYGVMNVGAGVSTLVAFGNTNPIVVERLS